MKIVITAGGTRIPLDEVRVLTNMSKGTMGTRLAETATQEGHEVILLTNPEAPQPFEIKINRQVLFQSVTITPLEVPGTIRVEHYSTYSQYAQAVERILTDEQPDLIFAAAAVSDYGAQPVEGKISSSGDLSIPLQPLPKVLPKMKDYAPKAHLVGFKLLAGATPEELKEAALKTLRSGQCLAVAGNDIRAIRNNQRQYILFTEKGSYPIPPSPQLAKDLFYRVIDLFT